MGISTTVHTWYGWIIDTTPEIDEWAEELDYDLPEGIMFLGMDCNRLVVGVEVFSTNDARWGPLEGSSTYTEEFAVDMLNNMQFGWKLDFLNDTLGDTPPMFHAFVNYS